MEYPLISEYREAILSAEDNFNKLSSLRPVFDSHGNPVMSSGNFAVVFKMKDENDGKLYAVKCFIKDQEGRDESYRKIADELKAVSSSYILPLRYLDNELFVDSAQCDREEFPVVVMAWVEGEPLDAYLRQNLSDKYALEMLSYRFNRMSAWLLAQPFAHGDLKPDNILVRQDGSLVLVDYDGMFVPAMKGEKAREIGSPDYRHPSRTDADFNEHIDDFSIAVIALSLKAIALNPRLKSTSPSGDNLLFSSADFQSPADSALLRSIQILSNDRELTSLLGIFYIAFARNSLAALSFRLFLSDRPKQPAKKKEPKQVEKIDTACSEKDISEGIADEFGVIYSRDGKRLLKCKNGSLTNYSIKQGTQVICDGAFSWRKALENITIPDSVISIGCAAFWGCESLLRLTIPNSVTTIGDNAFDHCLLLKSVFISNSVASIGNGAFDGCKSLQSVSIPKSITTIGNRAFFSCQSLLDVDIPNSVTTIGDEAFSYCLSLKNVHIPDSVTSIGEGAFGFCGLLTKINIPHSVTYLGDNPFRGCPKLDISIAPKSRFTEISDEYLITKDGLLISYVGKSDIIAIPDSVTAIGKYAFYGCNFLKCVSIPNTITTIGYEAFGVCELLQSVNIPSSVTTIGMWAFSECRSLQSIIIPKSVSAISDAVFWGCKSLQSVSIPDSIITIGKGAFYGCKSIRNMSIPNSVTTLGEKSFQGCTHLQSIKFPVSITSIGKYAFNGCKSLQSIDIPDLVTSIEIYTFFGCSSLKYITIPITVKSIGDKAFPNNCQIIRRNAE